MNNYRIPTIEELMTDGFEYEIRTKTKGEKLGSSGIVDLSKSNFEDQMKPIYAEKDAWHKQIKKTLSGPWEINDGPGGYTYTGTYIDAWDNPYQQRDYLLKRLEEGNIRTKIK